MLNADFFGLSSTDRGGNVNELTAQVSILIDLFLGKVGCSWETNLMSLLHSADNVHRHSVIPTENLVDLNVVFRREIKIL